jgi:Sec-independent protein secretion pathway component TatC
MADSSEDDLRPRDADNFGGPAKTFLEHLEDLRWMLVKSGAAILISLIVCLYMVDKIVWVLKRPLEQAALIQAGHEQKILVRLGTNNVGSFSTTTNLVCGLDLGTNAVAVLHSP